MLTCASCGFLPGHTQTINALIQTMRASGIEIQDEEGVLSDGCAHCLCIFTVVIMNCQVVP